MHLPHNDHNTHSSSPSEDLCCWMSSSSLSMRPCLNRMVEKSLNNTIIKRRVAYNQSTTSRVIFTRYLHQCTDFSIVILSLSLSLAPPLLPFPALAESILVADAQGLGQLSGSATWGKEPLLTFHSSLPPWQQRTAMMAQTLWTVKKTSQVVTAWSFPYCLQHSKILNVHLTVWKCTNTNGP